MFMEWYGEIIPVEENLFFGHICWGPVTTCITILGAHLEECWSLGWSIFFKDSPLPTKGQSSLVDLDLLGWASFWVVPLQRCHAWYVMRPVKLWRLFSYTTQKLTWLAGKSTMNEDVFPIGKWETFQCHVSELRGVNRWRSVWLTEPCSGSNQQTNRYWNYPPPSTVRVTNRITPFLVGEPYEPSFMIVTRWGVDLTNSYCLMYAMHDAWCVPWNCGAFLYTPQQLRWLAGKSTMNEDVFPIANGKISNVMLVFRGVNRWRSVWLMEPRSSVGATYEPMNIGKQLGNWTTKPLSRWNLVNARWFNSRPFDLLVGDHFTFERVTYSSQRRAQRIARLLFLYFFSPVSDFCFESNMMIGLTLAAFQAISCQNQILQSIFFREKQDPV